MQKEPKNLSNLEVTSERVNFSGGRLIFAILWLLALVTLFIPVAYQPTPYNGSALYYSIWGLSPPSSIIGTPDPFTSFFYLLGLIFGAISLFSWNSRRLRTISGTLMIFGLVVLYLLLNFISQADDCNPCYAFVIDLGLFVVLAVDILYVIGSVRLGPGHTYANQAL